MSTVASESSVAAADVTSNDDDVMQVVELDDNKALQKFVSETPAFPSGFVKVQPYNQVLPRVFLKDWPRIKSFKAKENDIWISSFPKCGEFLFISKKSDDTMKPAIRVQIPVEDNLKSFPINTESFGDSKIC